MGVLSNLLSDGSKLVVGTDLDTVCAGEIVSGRIFAVFKKPWPKTVKLMLEFYGYESTHVTWNEPVHGDKETTRRARSCQPVMSIQFVLADFSNAGGEPDSYEYPFSFRLPDDLHSTLCDRRPTGGTGGSCRLHYGLRTGLLDLAEAETRGMTMQESVIKVKKWAMMAEAPLVVSARVQPAVAPKPTTKGPSEKQLRQSCLSSLFCGGKPGSISLGVAVADMHAGRGQVLTFTVDVRNYSSRAVRKMTAIIEERVHWKAEENRRKGEDLILRTIAAGSRAGAKIAGSARLPGGAREAAAVDQDAAEMKQRLESALATGGDGCMRLQVSPDARESHSGELISCKHTLKVTLDVGDGMYNNPKLSVDLKVITRPGEAPVAPFGLHYLPNLYSEAEKRNAKAKLPKEASGVAVARPLELPVPPAPFGGTELAVGPAGSVVVYYRDGDTTAASVPGASSSSLPMVEASAAAVEVVQPATELTKLAELHVTGILNDDEYTFAKQKAIQSV